jgi:hypothetical protein
LNLIILLILSDSVSIKNVNMVVDRKGSGRRGYETIYSGFDYKTIKCFLKKEQEL